MVHEGGDAISTIARSETRPDFPQESGDGGELRWGCENGGKENIGLAKVIRNYLNFRSAGSFLRASYEFGPRDIGIVEHNWTGFLRFSKLNAEHNFD